MHRMLDVAHSSQICLFWPKTKLLQVLVIYSAPLLDMAPRISLAVHVTIPAGVIVRNHFAALDILHGDGYVVDLRPEAISHRIPLRRDRRSWASGRTRD
jgi:hypothetical protein